MKIEAVCPLRFYINLGVREDRRRECLLEFSQHRLDVERMPAVNSRYVRSSRGMGDRNRYACGLSQRLAIRAARKRGAAAVLIFEDDVVLHPRLRQKLAGLSLPEDWGIFYLGCLHTERPVPVAPGLVRVMRANDLHAVMIRITVYREVLRKIKPAGRTAPVPCVLNSDVALAELHAIIPTYAAWPNLAWQRWSHSNNVGGAITNYAADDGRQLIHTHAIAGLEKEMRRLTRTVKKTP